jgi:RNA polymerase sigma-70 factor (ECF subfamily)
LSIFRPLLERIARRLTRNSAEADDLVQETCRRALDGATGFSPGTDLKAWLSCILRNIHRDHQRRCSREVLIAALGEHLAERAAEESPRWKHVTDEDIVAAFESLPSLCGQVYILFTFEGLPYSEIARKLAIPCNTVGTRLRRARLWLRHFLSEGAVRGGNQPG